MYIDLFLKGLKDSSFPSSLAAILELRQLPSRKNKDKFKLLEHELERLDLVEFVRGRDNSTLSGQCEYNLSGRGLDYVLKGKSTIELFEEEERSTAINRHASCTMKNTGFIIHGHDDKIKFEVARFIEKELQKDVIILHEMPNKGKTIIEKFESNSDVDFAVALWTADDEGKSKTEEELSGRTRQNVIFETGYFIGKLGREKVIILFEDGVEKPSDYDGVVYISLEGNWKNQLRKEVNGIYE